MPDRPRILLLACDPQAALRGRGLLHARGYDVTMASLTAVRSDFYLAQFEAVVVANAFNEPERLLLDLAEIINEQATTPESITC